MRILILMAICLLLAAGPAVAQSDLFFRPKAPVAAGQVLKALITQSNGMTTLGDITVQGVSQDDLFAYWVGTHNGKTYVYDPYSTYWRATPVRYVGATLNFQGEPVDGWVRKYGAFLDYNNFFGRDGVYYKRIIIKRNRTRGTNKRRQIMYTYFINTQTLERSDSGAPPYLIIGDTNAEFVRAQMKDREDTFRRILEENPAFPKWQSSAFEAPSTVVIHNGAPDGGDDGMIQLAGDQLGALSIDR